MTNGIMPKLEYLNPPKYDQYPKYRDYLRKVTDFHALIARYQKVNPLEQHLISIIFALKKNSPPLKRHAKIYDIPVHGVTHIREADGFSAQQDAFAIVKLVQRMCVKKTSHVLLTP